MRESRAFGIRTKVLKSDEVIKKHFLVFEGAVTEQIYFDEIRLSHEKVGISELIELVPILRSFSEKGWSNPKKILERIIESLNEKKFNKITYESLINKMLAYFEDHDLFINNHKLETKMGNMMKQICLNKLQKDLGDFVDEIEHVCKFIWEELEKQFELFGLVDNIEEIIKNSEITYDENVDKICLIVDRDKESFTLNQYQHVVRICKEKGFQLCVTNPCFEFWLLLHFDEVHNLDRKQLLENPKVSNRKRYNENQLSQLCLNYNRKYKKVSYPASFFIDRIDTAIKNESKYCEDVVSLESSLGSNIGKFIETLRKKV